MKMLFASLMLALAGHALADRAPPSPTDVVMARMNALNQHDFEAFLSTYADDVWIGVYPDQELGSGHDHLEFIFAQRFAEKTLSVEVHDLHAADGYVVSETTTTFPDGTETGLAIYEVRNGLIRSVRFLRDGRRAKRVALPTTGRSQ